MKEYFAIQLQDGSEGSLAPVGHLRKTLKEIKEVLLLEKEEAKEVQAELENAKIVFYTLIKQESKTLKEMYNEY